MHVGLLEDDISIQEMLLLVLQDEGYTVTNYPDAEGCIEALKRAGEDGAPVPSRPDDCRLALKWFYHWYRGNPTDPQ